MTSYMEWITLEFLPFLVQSFFQAAMLSFACDTQEMISQQKGTGQVVSQERGTLSYLLNVTILQY